MSGRIWLNEAEIRALKEMRRPKVEIVNVDMSTQEMSIDKDVDIDVDNVYQMSTSRAGRFHAHARTHPEEQVYKRLYENLLTDSHEQQDKLTRATYKLGQLEARLKYSVPLLQYHKEKKLLKSSNVKLETELMKAVDEVKQLEQDYKIERFNKHIYLLILAALLLLQPIFWILLR